MFYSLITQNLVVKHKENTSYIPLVQKCGPNKALLVLILPEREYKSKSLIFGSGFFSNKISYSNQ